MSRTTTKRDNDYIPAGTNTVDSCLNKLGAIEDFEEELMYDNVDLMFILKVLKNGIYVADKPGYLDKCYHYDYEEIRVNLVDDCFEIITLTYKPDQDEDPWYRLRLPFDDFGKTYFFTQEEAEARIKQAFDNKERIKLDESWCWY